MQNINDVFMYFGTALIVLTNLLDFTYPQASTQRVIGCMIFFSQCFKLMLDWLNLFASTSFNVRLILETLKDMTSLAGMIILILVYFGAALYMLQLNAVDDDENSIVSSESGYSVIDSALNLYYLLLGEFHTDSYTDHPDAIVCYIFFILSTFMVQITLTNIMIGLMGDTFDRVSDERTADTLKAQITILNNMANTIREDKNEDDFEYFLYVITKKTHEDDL